MKPELSDLDLLRRSSDGDRTAFSVFMNRHAESVYRFLISLQSAGDEAEDALQECFVSAWRSAAKFRGAASARSWLFSIAHNALRRQHRKKAGEPVEYEPLEVLGAKAGWGMSSDFSVRLDDKEELKWALAQLPEEEREVVCARDLVGLTGEETASALGLSLAATKSRLHRGRLRLMGILRNTEATNA